MSISNNINVKCHLLKIQLILINQMEFYCKGSFTLRFFLIATAILLIATNGLTRLKCSHYATVTISPTSISPLRAKTNRSGNHKVIQCERALSDRFSLF